jgi:acyl-coenzyme A thioesterase PaaI-like protein
VTGTDVPPGYKICAIPDDEFVTTNAPLLFRLTKGGPRFAFRAENKHTNARGVVHGDTFADQVLGLIIQRALNTVDLATTSLHCDRAASAKPGDPIDTEATVTRVSDRQVLAKGTITCDRSVLVNAGGLWVPIRPSITASAKTTQETP